jgi:GTPase SAR1 family protein
MMDLETQKRYAQVMEKLINEVQTALETEIFEYAERLDCSEYRVQDSVVDEFINSAQNLGQIDHGITSPNLTDFFQWLMTEIFYEKSCSEKNTYARFQRPHITPEQWKYAKENADVRDLSTMDDNQWKDWLKEERETREECEKAKPYDTLKSMLGLMFGRYSHE